MGKALPRPPPPLPLTDVVNEFYGTAGARRLTHVGLVAALFIWGVINLALVLPAVPDSPIPDEVFRGAFGTSARLYAASLTAYLIGQLLDISVLHAVRRLTGSRLIWLRSTGSTVFSQAIDSMAVSFVFLAGTRPLSSIAANTANNYVGKLIMAVLVTPLIYLGHALFRRLLSRNPSPMPAVGLRCGFGRCLAPEAVTMAASQHPSKLLLPAHK